MPPRVKQQGSRRQAILEALAGELEDHPGQRITTAQLARAVGVSEAALYRHFPSKARMFEGLIEFVEDTIFSLINRILAEDKDALVRCEKLLQLLLGFAEKNPGMTRLLVGDALIGEQARLRERIGQFYGRIETQLKQVLREARLQGHAMTDEAVQIRASLLLAIVEGRWQQFVRSGFQRSPLLHWQAQWQSLQCVMAP